MQRSDFVTLKSTKPDTRAKALILERARHLTDFKWTPLRDVPTYTSKEGQTVLHAGVEVTGMPYSSLEVTDKFIYENVKFDTLLSAMANPDSVLYTKDIGGVRNSWTYYGIVCNGLVRYALQINRRISTKRWGVIPGMRKIADAEKYTFEDIKLCDVIYAFGKGRNHVELITDILRDENGKAVMIELSGAVRPHCKRRSYTEEEYFEKFKLLELWRYDCVDTEIETDAEITTALEKGVPSLPNIALDYGNRSNYFYGNETVISVFREGENKIEIHRNGNLAEQLHLSDKGRIVRRFEPGYYTVTLVDTNEVLEFCVNLPKITHNEENGRVTVCADPCDGESVIEYFDFREKTDAGEGVRISEDSDVVFYDGTAASLSRYHELTDEEKRLGVITRDIPEDAGYFKVYFKNRYGIWSHRMIKL